MSLTRSGLHHPVLPIKTIPPWIVLIMGKREPLHHFKEKPPQSTIASGCGKDIRPISREFTASYGFSNSGL